MSPSWHFSAVPTAPINIRSWVENGLNADMPQRPSLRPKSDIGLRGRRSVLDSPHLGGQDVV
jgi:hypothetical protein